MANRFCDIAAVVRSRLLHSSPSLGVAIAHRAAPNAGDRLWVEPRIRLAYLWGRRYRLELEAGVREETHELPERLVGLPLYPEEEETATERFFAIRWRADF